MPGDSSQAGSWRQFTRGLVHSAAGVPLTGRSGVLRPQALQDSRFRAIEFVCPPDNCCDLPLFGDQERLKLTRPQGGVDASVCLARYGMVDFRGDRIQLADARTHRGMSTGNQFLQYLVRLSGHAVLAHQSCLTRLDGGYRKSGLLRHGFNLFCVFFGPGHGSG